MLRESLLQSRLGVHLVPGPGIAALPPRRIVSDIVETVREG